VKDEILYRFRFPERYTSIKFIHRPGALRKFLNLMQNDWDVSLFHYRNNGADFGRVLTGLSLQPDQRNKFQNFVKELEKAGYYQIVDETKNQIYQYFLK
jgi:threonine dehydratase